MNLQCQHLTFPLRIIFSPPKCHICPILWLSTHTHLLLCRGQRSLEVAEVMSHAVKGGGDDTKRSKKWLLLFCAGWFGEMMLIISLWPTNLKSSGISLTNWAITHLKKKSPDCLLTTSNRQTHTGVSTAASSRTVATLRPLPSSTSLLRVLSYRAGLITTMNVLLVNPFHCCAFVKKPHAVGLPFY